MGPYGEVTLSMITHGLLTPEEAELLELERQILAETFLEYDRESLARSFETRRRLRRRPISVGTFSFDV
jgi:predicted nucleic acid-binding protein